MSSRGSAASISANRSVSAGDSPAAGSSSSSRRGSVTSASAQLELARARRARALRPGACARPASEKRSSASSAAPASSLRRPRAAAPAARSPGRSARRTGSSAGRSGRCRAGRAGARASRVTSLPVEAIRPAVGRRPPATRRKSVLLPAPFGPIRPWRSPSSRSRSTPSTARSPPNATLTSRSSSTLMPRSATSARRAEPAGEAARQQVHAEDEHEPEQQRAVPAERDADLVAHVDHHAPRRARAPTASLRRR